MVGNQIRGIKIGKWNMENNKDYSKYTVLIVDDIPINIILLKTMLARTNVRILTAINGQEALDTVRDLRPDVVLLDIQIPIMDGWEATSKIRSLNRRDAGSVPIIALSADAFVQDRMATSSTGLTGNLPKPINPQKLYDAIADYAEKALR